MSLSSELKGVNFGDHLCMIYDDDDDERLKVLILYIIDGLRKRERVFVLNEDENEIKEILKELIDLESVIDKQLFFLKAEELYLKKGFDSNILLEKLSEIEKKAIVDGFKGLRVARNASPFRFNDKETLEYEARVNLLENTTTLCLYDTRRFDDDFLKKVVRLHPKVIWRGKVLDNFKFDIEGEKDFSFLMEKIVEMGELKKEFQRLEEQFKILFEGNDGIFILREDTFVSCNSKALELFGVGKHDIIGKKLWDFSPRRQPDGESSKKKAMEKINAALSGEPQVFEWRVTSGGTPIDLEISLSRFMIDGKYHLMAIARDITERKKMEMALKESERRYRDLWENAGDILFIVDLEGNFLEANKTARDLFGYTREEIKRLSIKDVVDERYHSIIYQEIEKILEAKRSEVTHIEVLCYTKDGKATWIESKAKPIIENGRVKAIQGIARDITERKKMEEALKESEEMFRTLAEKSLVGIYLIQDGVFKYVNPKLAEDFGYKVNEIIGKPVLEFIHPEDKRIVEENIRKRIEGKINSIRYKPRVVRKDGQVKTFEVFGTRIIYRNKPAVIGTAIDITEEEIQKKKLERYGRFFKNAQDVFFILDRNGRFLDLNPKFAKMLGYKSEELIGHTSKRITHPDDLKGLKEYFKRVLDGETGRHEFRGITKDGEVRWFEVSEWCTNEGIEGIVRDITERKIMEKKLKESEEMFKTLSEKSLVGIYLIQDGVFKYVNPKLAELWGYSVKELIGRSPLEFIHPADRDLVDKNLELRIDGQVDAVNYMLRMVRKDGKIRANEVYGSKTIYRGKPAVIGTLIDITERLEMERKVKESEKKYRRIFETSPNMIAIVSEDGVLLEANLLMIETLGLDLGKKFSDLPPDTASRIMNGVKRALRENRKITFEAAWNDKIYIENYLPIELTDGRHCLIIMQDVTELVRLNRLLRLINNINNLIVKENDKLGLLRKACKELYLTGEYAEVAIFLVENGIVPVATAGKGLSKGVKCKLIREAINKKSTVLKGAGMCSDCDVSENVRQALLIPMISDGEVAGILRLCLKSDRKISDEEIEMLETLAEDLAFKIKMIELEELKKKAYEQIEQNIEQFAILTDHIRNPLAGILGLAEIHVSDEKLQGQFREFVYRIDDVIKRLDKGWLESETVRKFLKGKLREGVRK